MAEKAKKPSARKKARKSASKAPKRLTPMQRLFALEYIKDFNGTRAASAAGFSERTAAQQAHQLLHNPLVAAEIEKQKRDRLERTKIDADWVLKRLVAEAEADLAEIYDDDGNLRPVKEWPEIWRKGLVAGIEAEELFEGTGEDRVQIGYTRKVKLSDRIKRIELLGRHADVGAWKDRKQVEADEPLKELFRQIAGQAIRPKDGER